MKTKSVNFGLEKAYSAVYRGESLGNQELRIKIDHAVDRYEFLVWQASNGGRVLDVGCGNGFVIGRSLNQQNIIKNLGNY